MLIYLSKIKAILINLRFNKRLKLLKSDIIYYLIKSGCKIIIKEVFWWYLKKTVTAKN